MAQIFASERVAARPPARSGSGRSAEGPNTAAIDALQRQADEGVAQRLDDPELDDDIDDDMATAQGRMTAAAPVQRQPAPSGPGAALPAQLQQGAEALSGQSLADVRVHYNSSAPETVGAHAFAQGRDIHLAPGRESDLPHEAWHTVQQAEGRVEPTGRIGETAINDDPGLESEADRMGDKASRG